MLSPFKISIVSGLLFMAGAAYCAESEPAKYYHLDFVVKELDSGKVISARHYWTTMSTGDRGGCTIRTGSKVPVPVSGTVPSTSFTYVDVGVNIDCRSAQEVNSELTMDVTTEISSAAPTPNPPVIRQNKWNGHVIVALNKPTLIFSSDDVASKGQIQVELTASAVK